MIILLIMNKFIEKLYILNDITLILIILLEYYFVEIKIIIYYGYKNIIILCKDMLIQMFFNKILMIK